MLNKFKILSVAAVSTIAIASSANAASLSTSGDIKIRNALNISENQVLNFGTIEKPTSTVEVEVTTAGSVGSSTTASHIDTSTVAEGDYTISGSFIDTIDITASDNANVAGMEFTAITGDYDSTTGGDLISGITNQSAPGAGTALKVGAVLQVQNTVDEGDYSPAFTITVNYN
jgi:spore coat protein U-like protein